jgi:hypothetical protein
LKPHSLMRLGAFFHSANTIRTTRIKAGSINNVFKLVSNPRNARKIPKYDIISIFYINIKFDNYGGS